MKNALLISTNSGPLPSAAEDASALGRYESRDRRPTRKVAVRYHRDALLKARLGRATRAYRAAAGLR
jgi:hypothetical protein